MGIFKRVFDSIAGKPDVSARLSTSRNSDSIGHSDSVGFSSTQALSSFSSETALSASTESIPGITQVPPSVIFQPVADPAEDTNSFFEEVAEAVENAFETVCSDSLRDEIDAARAPNGSRLGRRPKSSVGVTNDNCTS
jgi:hypothetical protein